MHTCTNNNASNHRDHIRLVPTRPRREEGAPCGSCQRASGLGRSGVWFPSDKYHSTSRKSTSLHNDKDDQDSTGARWQRQVLQVCRVQIREEDSERQPTERVQEGQEESRERGEKGHSVGQSKKCGPSHAREPTVPAAPP